MELDHGYYCSRKHNRVPNPPSEWRKEYSQAYCSGIPVAAAQPQSSAVLWGQNILSKCEEESYSTQSRSKCFPFMQPASEELKQQPNGLDRRFSHDLHRHSIDGFSANSTISESHPSSSSRLQDDRRKQLLNLGLDEFGDITSLHKGSTLENAPIRLARNLGFTTVNRLPEKLLLGSVPWRLRAKRGCATHPRSIAERVRRTRISDRIRKLQKLVPNTDKQTNTAEMLDETIDYVKQLQQQVQELSEHESECRGLCKT